MTDIVVEVGPCAIRGPNDAPPELVSAALESIDDDLALVEERPVHAQDLWEDVICAVAGDGIDSVVVVCPTWWSSSRVERVRVAALAAATTVEVRRRTPMLRDGDADRLTTIVEIGPELAVVSYPAVRAVVLPLEGDGARDAEAVASAVGAPANVLIDVPVGVVGAEFLGAQIAERAGARGVLVRCADVDWLLRAADALQAGRQGRPADVGATPRKLLRDKRGAAVLVGVLTALALSVGFSARDGAHDSPTGDVPTTLLVEGRVGVMVPVDWTAQRITSGPGSARVQVVSPNDAEVVLNITQSTGLPDASLAATARSLRAALDTEPEGVFVDFNPSDRRAGKAAVTYRELRADHHVAWAVQIDGPVRIAIGCQSAPGRHDLVRKTCDRAIASAHAVS